MLRCASRLLTEALRQQSAAGAHEVAACCVASSTRGFRAVADVEINFNDREILKKYVGVRDHLSKEHGTKTRFVQALHELLDAAKLELPADSEYRRAVEATTAYRLKVCDENAADAAVEEVLDAHLEELIAETGEERRLFPIMAATQPWDVPAEYTVPVLDYHDATDLLDKKPAPK